MRSSWATATWSGRWRLQKPAVDLTKVKPVARLTSDYPVVVVAAASPIKTVNELVERLRANAKLTPMAIGAVGGCGPCVRRPAGQGGRQSPEDAVYLPFARNFELVDAVMGGKAVAGISGYGTFSAELASGKLRAIGVSSKKTATACGPCASRAWTWTSPTGAPCSPARACRPRARPRW
jgi:putative tricarboxylic transport membrane protein